MHWLWIHFLQETGISSSSSRAYNAWSGFLSDVGEVALIGGLIHLARARNCSVTHCRKLHTFAVAGTPWRACKLHHPNIDECDPVITPERIATFRERHPEADA